MEKIGFEPTILKKYFGLANQHYKPLSHFSRNYLKILSCRRFFLFFFFGLQPLKHFKTFK